MEFPGSCLRLVPSVWLILSTCPVTAMGADSAIRFALDIRPLLAEKCFFCHGPDETHREADLRLDDETSAKAPRDHGPAIVAGQPDRSAVWQRITSQDESLVMPPPDSNRSLTADQKERIRTWIQQGATWSRHWSFEPPVRSAADDPPSSGSVAIDQFVAAKLRDLGLDLAPRADFHTLARRLALDLVGLPPSPEEADALAAAVETDGDRALSRYVDRLLASPQFGEHWARMWLDLARYADTKGYEKDLGRDMWLYRDWVIQAFNADLPFDQFTVQQLAGDLLPGATSDSIIATAFHRNTMTNDEGGTDNEEFRVAAVKDRVDTTLQVWMGLTMGCAKCHSHKYDPITLEDYYRFYAVFNQTADADLGDDSPRLPLPTSKQEQQRSELAAAVKSAQEKLAEVRRQSGKSDASNEPAPDDSAELAAAKKEWKSANERLKELNGRIASVPVMRELAPDRRRTTRIHQRGNFLDPGTVVQAALLPGFGTVPADGPVDRLSAARWLVSPDNPLTARVMVNRVWARLFGLGLVETEEDFGAQGSLPSHPQLLDWLALHYRQDAGWSLKQLLKTIVLSRTYQQSSRLDARRREVDPRNVWLSRGARFRLPAETVRDQSLAIAGLLSHKVGGPSVMPPQPDGLWKSTYNAARWITATGEDRYRRGLYTYWKRTTPYPSMVTFDAGSREVCQIRRVHTNTPLQALVTLNDPAYLEMAAALARRMLQDAVTDEQRAERGLRLALIRRAAPEEVEIIVQAYRDAAGQFQAEPGAAAAFLRQANAAASAGSDEATLAAWAVAASVILNLDEIVMRG